MARLEPLAASELQAESITCKQLSISLIRQSLETPQVILPEAFARCCGKSRSYYHYQLLNQQ